MDAKVAQLDSIFSLEVSAVKPRREGLKPFDKGNGCFLAYIDVVIRWRGAGTRFAKIPSLQAKILTNAGRYLGMPEEAGADASGHFPKVIAYKEGGLRQWLQVRVFADPRVIALAEEAETMLGRRPAPAPQAGGIDWRRPAPAPQAGGIDYAKLAAALAPLLTAAAAAEADDERDDEAPAFGSDLPF